ncbi:hypothetical protein CEQ30_06400 [Nocardia brasiliensis]|nr:hypothetical protein CEQ30_06400 [Nocardia brasiliensis]
MQHRSVPKRIKNAFDKDYPLACQACPGDLFDQRDIEGAGLVGFPQHPSAHHILCNEHALATAEATLNTSGDG